MRITIEESGIKMDYKKFQEIAWEFSKNKTFVVKIGELEFNGKLDTIKVTSEGDMYKNYRVEKIVVVTVD